MDLQPFIWNSFLPHLLPCILSGFIVFAQTGSRRQKIEVQSCSPSSRSWESEDTWADHWSTLNYESESIWMYLLEAVCLYGLQWMEDLTFRVYWLSLSCVPWRHCLPRSEKMLYMERSAQHCILRRWCWVSDARERFAPHCTLRRPVPNPCSASLACSRPSPIWGAFAALIKASC